MNFANINSAVLSWISIGGIAILGVFFGCVWLGNTKLETKKARELSFGISLVVTTISCICLLLYFARIFNTGVVWKYSTLGERTVSAVYLDTIPERLRTSENYAKVKDELSYSKNGLYDTVVISCVEKQLTYSDYFSYVNTNNGCIDSVADVTLKINRNTGYINTEGILKTSIKDGKTYYTIGDFSLVGEDNDKKINSLSNNTKVKLEIQCDNSTMPIDKYTIISAETL